jgi:ubiquinone/menaquinone biosynthesis C-methylase UbiE
MKDEINPQQDILTSKALDVAKDWVESSYYELAEQNNWLDIFWNADYPFMRLFNKLDHSSILELACGRGRHSMKMQNEPNEKWVTDVNNTNVDFCKNRFIDDPLYHVFLCNGIDLRPMGDASLTAVFCYDAMVHFDCEVVSSYLRDTFRVLKSGGRALLHHSNYSGNPGGDYRDNPHWRNFMTASLFFHFACKAGFKVVESNIITWGTTIGLDGLTLLEKPA